MELQKTSNSQSNLTKEEQSWEQPQSLIQTVVQSYSNQNSIALAQNRHIEQ